MTILAKYATHDGLGNARADLKDFSECKWEIQIKYTTGWETHSEPHWSYVADEWATAKRMKFKVRLLRDGRQVEIRS